MANDLIIAGIAFIFHNRAFFLISASAVREIISSADSSTIPAKRYPNSFYLILNSTVETSIPVSFIRTDSFEAEKQPVRVSIIVTIIIRHKIEFL